MYKLSIKYDTVLKIFTKQNLFTDSCKDAHGVGMDSIRNSLNLFNGSAVEKTSVSTAESATSNYHKSFKYLLRSFNTTRVRARQAKSG